MAELVNLRRHRKRRAREEEAGLAAGNRARHGAPKAETAKCEAIQRLERARLEGQRREREEA